MNAIGRKLKSLRESADISQEQLAGDANIARRVLQKIEAGNANPTLTTLESLAKALAVDITDLFDRPKVKTVAEMRPDDFKTMLNIHLDNLERVSGTLPIRIAKLWSEAPEKARRLCEVMLTPAPKNLLLLEQLGLSRPGQKTVSELLHRLHGPPKLPPKG